MDDDAFLERPFIEVAYGNPKKPTLLRVTPLRVRQIPAFQKYFHLAISTLAEREGADVVELDIAEMIAQERQSLIKALAAATDTTEEFIAGGILLSQFLPLVEAVLRVNHDFIFAKGDAPKSGKPQKAVKWGWADCVQHLVSAGHAHHEVMEYTFTQMKAYSEAVSRAQRLASATALVNMRTAQAEYEVFNNYFEELVNG